MIDIGMTPGKVAGIVASRIRNNPDSHNQNAWIGVADGDEIVAEFTHGFEIEEIEDQIEQESEMIGFECHMVACVAGHAALVAYQVMTPEQRRVADGMWLEDIAADVLGFPGRKSRYISGPPEHYLFKPERTRAEVLAYLDEMALNGMDDEGRFV